MKFYSVHPCPPLAAIGRPPDRETWLNLLELAEPLGFDGIALTDSPLSATPSRMSPAILAAILARRTKQVKLMLQGTPLPLLGSPHDMARDLMTLNLLAEGRLIAGFGLGSGTDYATRGVNTNDALAMLAEGLKELERINQGHSLQSYRGTSENARNLPPASAAEPALPLECWISGNGSRELIELAAARGLSYAGFPHVHQDLCHNQFKWFRTACKKQGPTSAPGHIAWQVPVYVAEDDDRAWAEFEPVLSRFAHSHLQPALDVPPGYMSITDKARLVKMKPKFLTHVLGREALSEGGYAIVGSPESVRSQLQRLLEKLQIDILLGMFHLPEMPPEQCQRNLQRFAQDVLPELRAHFGSPDTTSPSGQQTT